jgi:DNA mismatch repair protein MutS
MANPIPEIMPEEVLEVRKDAIIATGRSDYHNQVNNVMGFPYIFRGALDVRAREINVEMKVAAAEAIAELARAAVPDEVNFSAKAGEHRLSSHFGVQTSTSFGEFLPLESAACGAIIDYVALTQLDAAARLDAPKREHLGEAMQLDGATRRNLELTQTLAGNKRGSLLDSIDETVTSAGSRTLAQWLASPSCQISVIEARQDAVAWAYEADAARQSLRATLKAIADMERAIGRLALGRGGPRDLLLLATSLTQTSALHEQLRTLEIPALLREAREALAGHHALGEKLAFALKPEVGMFARDGNFIADGFRADLDEHRRLRDESKRVIAAMETQLKDATAIPSLKIKHNNVLGYFIEITPIHEKKIPPEFIHRQVPEGHLQPLRPRHWARKHHTCPRIPPHNGRYHHPIESPRNAGEVWPCLRFYSRFSSATDHVRSDWRRYGAARPA